MKKNFPKSPLHHRLHYYSLQAKGLPLLKSLPASGLLASAALLATLPTADLSAQVCSKTFANFILTPADPLTPIDFDQDGNAEIQLRAGGQSNNAYHRFPSAMLSTMRTVNGRPQRLAAGAVISAGQAAMDPAPNTGFFTRTTYGNWLNNANNNPITGYFGFSFVDFNNARHYGWMQLEIKDNRNVGNIPVNPYIKILGWGYNTTPNASITAGQTSPGGTCLILPVELSSFEALPQSESIRLQWRTETEKDNAGFELQRSEDGRTFKTLQFIEGAGTTTEKQTYSFDDKTVRKGQPYFYRLKQIDNSGSFKYSDIVRAALASDKLALEQISPNPVVLNSAVQLRMRLPQAAEVTVTVFDMRGIAVQTEQHTLTEGLQTLPVQLTGLPAGAYFVKATANGEASYQKLLIGR